MKEILTPEQKQILEDVFPGHGLRYMRPMTDRRLKRAVERASGLTQEKAWNLLQSSFPMWIGEEKSLENKERNKVAAAKRRK